MKTFLLRSKQERTEVIEETAARLRIGRPAIVEKDFWVCWALSQLFSDNVPFRRDFSAHPFLFKGGTSLSKVYGLIDRFSEDIDLTIDRRLLENPEVPADEAGISKNERKRRIDNLAVRCSALIQDEIVPYLRTCIGDISGARVEIDPEDPQTVKLIYPYVLSPSSYGDGSYVNSEIRLEFGARGALWPASRGTVTAYVAAEFPEVFEQPLVNVWAMDVQRTFWEKATILHAAACSERLGNSERQSRHYADLARLATSAEGQHAILNTQLLVDVAEHKAMFFAANVARYELARPGTLRLIPPDRLVAELRADYSRMREMFINEPPSFDEVMGEIAELELQINQ